MSSAIFLPRYWYQRIRDSRIWWTALQIIGMFGLFFIALSWIQFSTPNLPDNDGYYHIRFAALMREQGLKPPFPYLPLTILNPREFYDHHFLYHVALIPFSLGDLRLGAKWSAVIFASLAFLVIWWLFHRRQVPYAGIWSLGLLGLSQAFLFRMSVTRAQSLSLLVLALGLYCMLEGRYQLLGGVAFLYVWMYDAFPLILLMAMVFALASWLSVRRLEWHPLAWAGAGVALGLVLNLYFPFDLLFIFRHLIPKLTETTAVNVGSEWYPYTTQQLLSNSGFALLIFLLGILALGLREEKMDLQTGTSLLLAIIFLVMLFQARRFVEYFPPFALIFAAFAWKPLIDQWPEKFRKRFLIPGLSIMLLIGMARTLPDARASMQTAQPYDLFAGASRWLMENTPAQARVFQTDWDDFPRLFYYNTRNTYLVGLDPTYMQLYDPFRYDFWVQITQGKVENLSEVIPRDFGARYVVSDLKHGDFLRRADADAGMVQVFRDDNAVVFEIR
jgi:hypothetical protein